MALTRGEDDDGVQAELRTHGGFGDKWKYVLVFAFVQMVILALEWFALGAYFLAR